MLRVGKNQEISHFGSLEYKICVLTPVPPIEKINYEICVLQALREKLRCKEIWIEGADRYRNPEEDLPKDFENRREEYYEALKLPCLLWQ